MIVAVDDTEPGTGDEARAVASLIASRGIGSTLRLRILREGKQIELPVKLASRPRVFSGNPEIEANVRSVCQQWFTSGSQDQATAKEAYKYCAIAVRQTATKDNDSFFVRLNELLGPCRGATNVMASEVRARIYEIKPAIDLTDADLASIWRRAVKCEFERKTDTPEAMVLLVASNQLVASYAADRSNAIARFVEGRRMAEYAKLEAEKRHAHLSELARNGYSSVTLSDLKIDARSLHGKKVAVSGLLFVLDNDSAVLLKDERDENPVVVSLREASRGTRQATIGRCDNRSRGCRIEIKGTVVGDRPVVGILAD